MINYATQVKTETEKFKGFFLEYCVGNGIDIGCGVGKITPRSIGIDLRERLHPKNAIVNLIGSAENLYWFTDGCLDYVYSSNVLEDFVDKKPILNEWLRVLRVGGFLIILMPDQKKYVDHIVNVEHGTPNPDHADDNWCYDKFIEIIKELNVEIVKEYPVLEFQLHDNTGKVVYTDCYEFGVVLRKK